MSINQTVTVDGVSYQLSDYPVGYVSSAQIVYGDAAAHLGVMGYTPDNCPDQFIIVTDVTQFRNGLLDPEVPANWHPVGIISPHIDLDADLQVQIWSDDGHDAALVQKAWSWCERHAEGDWVVRFSNFGKTECTAIFGFAESSDEAAFLAANKGA